VVSAFLEKKTGPASFIHAANIAAYQQSIAAVRLNVHSPFIIEETSNKSGYPPPPLPPSRGGHLVDYAIG
jgi:hypothetical protein